MAFKSIILSATVFILSSNVNAAVVDLSTVTMTVNPTSLSFTADGVGVTATGHHVEYNAAGTSTTIYGPVQTSVALEVVGNWTYYHFGRTENQQTGDISGLGLATNLDLEQTDSDSTASTFQPGFDNMPDAVSLVSFQFALFAFDTPVNVSQVILDSVSNFKNHVWVAGGTTAPDLSQDFLTAFGDFSFINSPHLSGPTHTFAPMEGITYLAIGAPPKIGSENSLGPVTGVGNNAQFYIEGINVSAVPVPAAIWLFCTGLIGLIGIARRK